VRWRVAEAAARASVRVHRGMSTVGHDAAAADLRPPSKAGRCERHPLHRQGRCAFLEYGSRPKCSLTTSADSGGNPACPRRRPGLHQACVIGGLRCRRGTSRCSRPWRGDLLSSLGYERAADSTSSAVRALAQTLSELVGRGVGAAPGHNRTANRPRGLPPVVSCTRGSNSPRESAKMYRPPPYFQPSHESWPDVESHSFNIAQAATA
jgi:hypothetical protein